MRALLISVFMALASSRRLHMESRLQRSHTGRPEETCNWFSSKPLKHYHFEFSAPGGHSIAMHLARDPEKPSLDIHVHRRWSVWLPAPWYAIDEDADLVWEPNRDGEDLNAQLAYVESRVAGMRGADDLNKLPDLSWHVDLLEHLAYVRRVRLGPDASGAERPNGIELGYLNGLNGTLVGGAVLQPVLSKSALLTFLRAEINEASREKGRGRMLQGAVGNLTDAGLDLSSDTMLGAFVVDLPQMPTRVTAAATPLFLGGLEAGMAAAGFENEVLSDGATVGGSIVEGLERFDGGSRRELDFFASEKLFDKLWCHPAFSRCSGDQDVVVPPGRPCPVF